MRFLFKTAYEQDIALAKHAGHQFWYGALMVALLVAPWALPEYWLAQISFVLIYSIAGLGLMLLAGFTGQVSIGHAAFMGVGGYTQAVLTGWGVPFPLALAGATALSGVMGVVISVPALRVKGIYLGMATLAFGFIVEEVFARWESVTGGNAGHPHQAAEPVRLEARHAGIVLLPVLALCGHHAGVLNLLRAPTGEPVAIRDSEISAQSGIWPGKGLAFALSAAIAGVPALYATRWASLRPVQPARSVELLLLVVVGGLGFVQARFWAPSSSSACPSSSRWPKIFCRRPSARQRVCRARCSAWCWWSSCCSNPWACTVAGSRSAPGSSSFLSTARACSSGRRASRSRIA
jgi:branched-chain amino acid transport system permease protein